MKYAVERVSIGKGEYNFMVKLDKDGRRYNASEAAWVGKADDEYIAHAIGYSCSRHATLKAATEAVKQDIGRVLELDGICDSAELGRSVEEFDNGSSITTS